jgi:hypothetical protein
MFQNKELRRLQEQKDLLVLQSEANRRQLAEDWQKLRSGDYWLDQASGASQRHPLWTAVLAAAAGFIAIRTLRKPGALMGGISQLGKLASAGLAAWRLFSNKSNS